MKGSRTTISVIGFVVLATAVGCTGRRITTAVEDQAFQPGLPPAPVVEAAKVEPPPALPPEPPKEERPAAAMPEQPTAEPSAPARIQEPETAAPPPAPSPVEEVRIAEQPVAPAPPSQAIPPSPAVPTPGPQPTRPAAEFTDVFFDFDRFTIRDDARSGLDANAVLLKSNPDRTIVIEGHCDERGTSAYNLVLGERRAQAARQYLQDLGVAPSQIRIVSYGKERPFCTEHSEACWQSNRRAHFRQP
jgi:peptidoglycan-associated lipoprotein